MAEGLNSTPVASDKRRARRLLFIGWDGADPHALRSLLAAGRLPHLRSLVDAGVALELSVPRPRFPQAAWTSLATGKRPHEHGVLHACYQAGEGPELRPVSRHDRKCSALWNVLGRAGLHSHIIGWPVTHPPDSIAGICVSDYFTGNPVEASRIPLAGPSVMPPEAAQIFNERSMTPDQVEDVTLAQLLPSHVIGSRAYSRVDAACRELLAQTATLFRSIRWCLDTQRWDFAACVFPGIRRSHELTNWLRSQSPATAELCESIIAGCYEHHDLLLGQLLSQVEENTYLMVVSPTSNAFTTTSENSDANVSSIADSVPSNNALAVICGPDVCRQAGIMPRSLLDIAPTILALFGLPYGKDMGGRPLRDLFAGGLVSEMIETWDSPTPIETPQRELELAACGEGTADGPNRDRETQHLAELGYIDPLDVAANEAARHCERTATLNRAISLMDAGLFAQAVDVLERLTKEYPDWLDCRSLLAETYYRAGRYHAAREQIEWLTCHGSENPQLYLLSAAIGIADRQFERALEEVNCARRGTAMPSGFSFLVGSIHLRKRDFAAAQSAFRQAIESDSQTAPALDGMASVKLHLKEYEEAAVFALDALEKDMRLAKAHYHLAVALYFLNKPQEALQALTSWAALEPQAAAPYRWMASVHRKLLRDLRQAEACIEQGKRVIRRRQHSHETDRVDSTSVPTFAQ